MSTLARLLVFLRLDGPVLRLCAWLLRRAPGSRVAASLGWHLGQQSTRDVVRVARLRSGSRMAVDVRDHAHRHVFLHGIYEEPITRLMERVSRPGWTVVDVGANAGYHSLLAADLGGGGTRVVAFEPNPRMGALLRRSLELNPRAQIEHVGAACGEREGPAGLIASPDPHNTGLARIRFATPGPGETPVVSVRLDSYCAAHELAPDLIKVDVEGAETAVMRGSESLLRANPPEHVICEVWPESRDELFGYMESLGYEPHGIARDGSLTDPAQPGTQWSDVCFHHPRAGSRPDPAPAAATVHRSC